MGLQPVVKQLIIDPFIQQGSKLTPTGESGLSGFGFSVALSDDGNTALVGGPWDYGGPDDRIAQFGAAWVFTRSGSTWALQGKKLTGFGETGRGEFGTSVALSGNGNTALVGGPGGGAGAAWVFTRSGSTWAQQGSELTGSETGVSGFGSSVALSGNGSTALIGGAGDNNRAGAAWVFTRSGFTWKQHGSELTGGGETGQGWFGWSVALSADGNTALIGGPSDVGGVGAAWVFTRSGSTWKQKGSKLTGGGETGVGGFGSSVALSADGKTALIGGPDDNTQYYKGPGAAWVFTAPGSRWDQEGKKLTIGAKTVSANFGASVALSADGKTALIGGPNANTHGNNGAGATWLFTRSHSTWAQQGSELAGGGETGQGSFGWSVALSADGNTALVGGQSDNDAIGASWVFVASCGLACTPVTSPVPTVPITRATTTTTTTTTASTAAGTVVTVIANSPETYSFTLSTPGQAPVYSYQLKELSVPAEEATFKVTNAEGIDTHNFGVCTAPLTGAALKAPTINLPETCTGMFTPPLAPGDSATLTVDFTTPGEYEYLSTFGCPKSVSCDAGYGMIGKLRVT